MKKVAFALSLSFAILCCFWFSPSPGAAMPPSGQAIHISMVSVFNEDHPVSLLVWKPWIEEIKNKTNGRLIITLLPSESVGPARGHFDSTRRGLVGIGHCAVSLARWQLPATSVMDVPSPLANTIAASDAFWTLYEASPEIRAEFEDIKLLALHSGAPSQLNMARGGIVMLDDFRDNRLLVPSAEHARILRSLGAKPRILHYSSYRELLERNMANGCLLPMGDLLAAGADRPVTSLTLANLYLSAYWLGMNMDVYQALPPDCRAALDESCGRKLSLALGEAMFEINRRDLKSLVASGVSVNRITIAERRRWLNLVIPTAHDDWFKLAAQSRLQTAGELYLRARAIFEEAADKYAHRN